MSYHRAPRSWRWLVGVSPAIKTVPLPDLGVDEVVLVVVGIVLGTFYGPALQAILEEDEGSRGR